MSMEFTPELEREQALDQLEMAREDFNRNPGEATYRELLECTEALLRCLKKTNSGKTEDACTH